MDNVLITKLYTPCIHKSLLCGKLDKTNLEKYESDINKGGVYLVMIRVLKKDSKVIVYKHLYYDTIFVNILIYYLLRKENFNKSNMFKDWGDFLTIIEEEFGSSEFLGDLFKHRWQLNAHWNTYSSSFNQPSNPTLLELFDQIKKLNIIVEDVPNCLSYLVSKDYNSFLTTYIDSSLHYEESNFSSVYLAKDCLFVVRDLESFLNKVRSLGFEINKGIKSQRNQVDSISSFLSELDSDFRNYIYTSHKTLISKSILPSSCILPRSKFSFKNIHMNIGNVRTYSTTNSMCVNRRQELFQNNYEMVTEILEKNFYVGSKKTQLEIEKALYNQEDLFSNNNIIKCRFHFNEEVYNLLQLKLKELEKLMSYDSDGEINYKFASTTFLPLVKEIISVLGVEYTAKLLISYFLQIVSKETTSIDDIETPGISTMRCFHKFGKEVYDKFVYKKYDESSKLITLTEFIDSIKNGYKEIYEDSSSYAMLGGYFVWNLVVVNLLYEVLDKHPENSIETTHYLRIVDNVRKLLIKNNIRMYHLPQKLPMVCEPNSYVYSTDITKNKLGGYLLNDVYYSNSLIKHKIGTGKDTTIRDENILVKMVNDYMKTPYKINTETLNFVYENGISKGILIDSEDKEVIKFINNPYAKYSSKKGNQFRSIISKISMERNILSIADVYSKLPKIYFPVRLDFRTRIYCNTDYFDFQKSDLAKGLISFANAGKLNKHDNEGIDYFKAFGANMFGGGLDKRSLSYRSKWVDSNSNNILAFESNDIVNKAENKACFVSFCFEYRRFVKFMNSPDEIIFETHLPIQLDATCNGYQHLALLTKEKGLLSKLNLSKSNRNKNPEDFYSYVKDNVYNYIQEELNIMLSKTDLSAEETRKISSYKKILDIRLSRAILKLVIMRESYSSTIPGLVRDILAHESFTTHNENNTTYYTYENYETKFDRQDIVNYVMCIKYVIGYIAPKIKKLSVYLDGVVSICTRLNIPIPWVLPHGADIPQSYLIEQEKSISAFSFTKSRYTVKKYLTGHYDLTKQKRAIRPNLIHSLDATTVALLYNSLSNKVDLYTVHDCFAVTANNVPLLINKLKMVYIKLYSSDSYLVTFDSMLRITINNTFGDSIFKVNDKYINIPNKSKFKKEAFPDVDGIINLDKSKLKKVAFPDVSSIVSDNVSIVDIENSQYPII